MNFFATAAAAAAADDDANFIMPSAGGIPAVTGVPFAAQSRQRPRK